MIGPAYKFRPYAPLVEKTPFEIMSAIAIEYYAKVFANAVLAEYEEMLWLGRS